jgi:hypothetical protein
MTRVSKLIAAIFVLALPACAPISKPPPQAASPEVVAAEGITVSKVEGGKFLIFAGPKRQHGDRFLGDPDTNYYLLRSFVDTRNGEVAHQVYVQYSYDGGPYKWSSAHGQDNRTLRFIPLNHDEITCDLGCSYADEFAAALPDPLLRQSPNGLSVIFVADHGATKTIAVPGELIAKQLGAVDTVRAAMKTAAASPPAAAANPAVPPAAPVSSAPGK